MAEESSDQEQQRLIVGLGNPGEKYRDTRHNLGFRVLDRLARALDGPQRSLECNSLVASTPAALLAWPQTYMNRSGYAVRCLSEKHGFQPDDALVVYDDVSLPLGTIRLRGRGSPGGHRGMESVIYNLRTDAVARLRLGVAPSEGFESSVDLSDFVLTNFSRDELETVDEMVERSVEACRFWLAGDMQETMNRFNG